MAKLTLSGMISTKKSGETKVLRKVNSMCR